VRLFGHAVSSPSASRPRHASGLQPRGPRPYRQSSRPRAWRGSTSKPVTGASVEAQRGVSAMIGLQLQVARLWAPVVAPVVTGRRRWRWRRWRRRRPPRWGARWTRCGRCGTWPPRVDRPWWARRAAAGSRRGGGLDGAHGPRERLLGLGTGRGGRLGPPEVATRPRRPAGGGQSFRCPRRPAMGRERARRGPGGLRRRYERRRTLRWER
jgi:hypothetical protein